MTSAAPTPSASAAEAASPPNLDVQVETSGPCSRVLRIRIPAARVDREIEETYRNVQRSVQFPGFRPGKAPRKLVEAKLGERVLSEVLERLVQTAYDEAVDSTKLAAIGSPRLKDTPQIDRGSDLAITIEVDVRPEFVTPKLEDVEVKRPVVTITDEDVDAELKRLREERATVSDAGDDPLEENGVLALHVKIAVDGAVVVDEKEVEWRHPTDSLGGMAVPGLAAALLGKRRGESVELPVTLPPEFRDEALRGKGAAMTLVLEDVRRVTVPALDDAFAAEMDYDSLDEMRAEVRKDLDRRGADAAERALDAAIAESLLGATPFEVPPSLVLAETERMLKRYELQLRQQTVPEEQIAKLTAEARGHAETRVTHDLRVSFLLDKVATERKVFVTENEIRQEVATIASRYDKPAAEMEEYMERNRLLPALRSELREKKTLRELRGIVKLVEPTSEAAPPAPTSAEAGR